MTDIINFDDYSFDQLKGLKADLTSFLKNARAEMLEAKKQAKKDAQAEKTAEAKKIIEIGIEATVSYKNGTITGTVIKTTDRTFTIEFFDEETQKTKTQWRYYYQAVLPE
jgi:hypothetical protein